MDRDLNASINLANYSI